MRAIVCLLWSLEIRLLARQAKHTEALCRQRTMMALLYQRQLGRSVKRDHINKWPPINQTLGGEMKRAEQADNQAAFLGSDCSYRLLACSFGCKLINQIWPTPNLRPHLISSHLIRLSFSFSFSLLFAFSQTAAHTTTGAN